jgi:hypothetical protein
VTQAGLEEFKSYHITDELFREAEKASGGLASKNDSAINSPQRSRQPSLSNFSGATIAIIYFEISKVFCDSKCVF